MNHIGDSNKMISDTPRTDEQINGKPCTRFEVMAGDSLRNASVPSEFARELERELNAANERINRLEEVGDWMRYNSNNEWWCGNWDKAKEAKP